MDKIKRCADVLYKAINRTEKSLYSKGHRATEKIWFERLASSVIEEYKKEIA